MSVTLGIDELQRQNFAPVTGARVGIVTNHTGRNRAGHSIVDLLQRAEAVDVRALFGPEHGLLGRAGAGEKVADTVDELSGLQIFSLYGETRRPTPEMLHGLDALVFDMQDVGARFYTFTSTMAYCLEACAEHGLRFVVLDRPNLINGLAIEGPMIEDAHRSFVGYLQVPIRHGLTMGELALLHRATKSLDVQLDVVRMKGWERRHWWDDCGLDWVPPSPAMISLNTAILYPGTCMIEGTNVSEGRGTDTPFECIGAPWIDGDALANDLNHRELAGVMCSPTEFCPEASKWKDQICPGIIITVLDRDAFDPVAFGLHLVDAIHRQNPIEFSFNRIVRHVGKTRVVEQLTAFTPVQEILEEWQLAAEKFREEREAYLLYE